MATLEVTGTAPSLEERHTPGLISTGAGRLDVLRHKLLDPVGAYLRNINPISRGEWALRAEITRLTEENIKIRKGVWKMAEELETAAHDAKSPMTLVSGYAQIMQRMLEGRTDIPADVREKLSNSTRVIIAQTARASTRIDDSMRTAGEIENDLQGKKDLVCTILQNFGQDNSQVFESRGIELQLILQPQNPQVLIGLRDVLDVLVENSVEAMADYEAGQEKKISVGYWVVGGKIKIQVTDTGKGIPEEILGRIGEKYFTTKSKGHGVGFERAKCRVLGWGGEISIESYTKEMIGSNPSLKGKTPGTIVTITLPLTN